ncbi:MAG: hypothetical protein ABIJ59_09420 [Pseudomonadota bacterium]
MPFFRLSFTFTQDITMRFPLYLTLILAVGAFITTLLMKDISSPVSPAMGTDRIRQAFAMILDAGLWILKTPFALSVILFGMLFDGIIRMVITLSSQYYRMIELPESIFGILGSLVAMLGFVIPKLAGKLVENYPVSYSLWITVGLTFTGLVFMNFFWPYTGLIHALITFSAMYFTGFFVSYHLNKIASSEQRATILSFKGLAYNVSYGFLGILYVLILKTQKQGLESNDVRNMLFMDTFYWFPVTFLICFILILIFYTFYLKPKP